MYIIELFFKRKKKKSANRPCEQLNNTEYTECDHLFVPIDSDKQTLACTKCGLIIKNKPANNFFMK